MGSEMASSPANLLSLPPLPHWRAFSWGSGLMTLWGQGPFPHKPSCRLLASPDGSGEQRPTLTLVF